MKLCVTNGLSCSTGPMFHPRGPPGPMGMRGPGPLPGELTYPIYCAVEGCDFIVLFAQLCSFLNFPPMPSHVLVDFMVFPPRHGRSVTDF